MTKFKKTDSIIALKHKPMIKSSNLNSLFTRELQTVEMQYKVLSEWTYEGDRKHFLLVVVDGYAIVKMRLVCLYEAEWTVISSIRVVPQDI